MATEFQIDKSLITVLRELHEQQGQSTDIQTTGQDDDGFVLVVKESVWTRLFCEYFMKLDCLDQEMPNVAKQQEEDDMLFYVKSQPGDRKQEVLVFRKAAKNVPGLGDPHINWEESVYLNLILHELEYTVTCAACSKLPNNDLKVIKRTSLKLYASPHMRRMDSKGESTEQSYPNIYFNIDSFDEVFKGLFVREGEMICVELVTNNKNGSDKNVIFLGSVKYDALKKVYDSKASLGAKMAHKFSFGLVSNSSDHTEFIRMRGPRGKGYAEMSINQYNYRPDFTDEADGKHTPLHKSQSDTTVARTRTESICSCGHDNSDSYLATTDAVDGGRCYQCGKRKENENSSKVLSGAVKFFRPRRKSNMVLSTRLTYISLPWSRIIRDILEIRQKPLFSKHSRQGGDLQFGS